MNQPDLRETWEDYYAVSEGDTVLRDRNFFRMESEALRDALLAAVSPPPEGELRIIELGSGTGALARFIIEALPAAVRERTRYRGIDFSLAAVERAASQNLPGAEFIASDFLEYLQRAEPADLIISQRSIMAVINGEDQQRLLEMIRDRLQPDGRIILSEGVAQAQARVDALRRQIGIGSMDPVWHCRYLDCDQLFKIFPDARLEDFASLYWLITRVIYPFAADPEHNTPLHDLAAQLPQMGDYGLVKIIVAKRPDS